MKESPKAPSLFLKAEDVIPLRSYTEIHRTALPLVASVEYLMKEFKLKEPRIVEVGPVPTFHYAAGTGLGVNYGKYDPDKALKHAEESDVPPIWYLAERNPHAHFAAVSTHDIPYFPKRFLLGNRGDLLISELGPERKRGINPDDVFDEEYRNSKDIMKTKYPTLLAKLGGQRPDIVLGRHVFDKDAPYLVGKLTTMAAMMLKKGGLLVSHVYFSGPQNSQVPLGNMYYFPFDSERNMRHILTLEFVKGGKDKYYVFVYQKIGDKIRPPYRQKSIEKK